MTDYLQYVDVSLSGFEKTKKLENYKKDTKDEMRSREIALRERGLSDSNVINDLIISEYTDIKHQYKEILKKSASEKHEKERMIIKFLMAVAYYMAIGIAYFYVSFHTHDWAHSWLIIDGGITVFIVMLLLMPKKAHFRGRRFFSLDTCIVASTFLLATFAFLLMQLVFHIPHSYIIFIATVSLTAAIDAIVAVLTHNKFAIIRVMVAIPVIATFGYISLGLLSMIPWVTGWLLIIASFIIDILIFIWAYIRRHRLDEEEEY